MYVKTTKSIKIHVEPAYLEEKSAPAQDRYVWAYTILIENLGSEEVRLLTRCWHITDARGHRQEVRGDGVVGEQPILPPGGQFRYTSGVSLPTPSGIMVGSYMLENKATGAHFDVEIPAFSLDSPYQVIRTH